MTFPAMEATAILISSLICFSIGALWFSPALFGARWMKSLNIPADEYSRYFNGRSFLWFALFVIILNTGISVIIGTMGYTNMREGIYAGIILWAISAVPFFGITTILEKRPFSLFIIYSGYFLAALVISSALFAMWR